MNVSDLLLRESSYNRKNLIRTDLDYGGFYHIKYTDLTNDKRISDYFIFVLHPNLKGKTHCLDLSKIEVSTFNKFFETVRINNELEVERLKRKYKGYVKKNIRIGNKFYTSFVKPNKRLMKNYPYKTLDFDKINNIRYIEYDI